MSLPIHGPLVQGFVTLGGIGNKGSLNICQLPIKVRLDCVWPTQRISLQATPHKIAHLKDLKLYVILVTRQVIS